MNIYNIINPSDIMTMEAPSIVVAGVAVGLIGEGTLGAEGPDGKTPVLTGWDEWLQEHGIDDLGNWVDSHADELAAALDSVMCGTVKERENNDRQLLRSNNIQKAAYLMANRLRQAKTE